MIAPDLTANKSLGNLNEITPSEWLMWGKPERHLYACVVALHRSIQNGTASSIISSGSAMFFHHRARAAGLLSKQLSISRHTHHDPSVFWGILMFMASHIQESAYSPWRMHLNAAISLRDLWRRDGFRGPCDFAYFNFMVADIYGTSTMSLYPLSGAVIEQHMFYMNLVGRLKVDASSSLTPIPDEMITATAAINILRAMKGTTRPELAISPLDILSFVQAFAPSSWAQTVCCTPDSPSQNDHASCPQSSSSSSSDDHGSWNSLALCYQAANILYLTLTVEPRTQDFLNPHLWIDARMTAYKTLTAAIRDLLDRKCKGGTHYKFILWPMVIAGVEAVARRDRAELDLLSKSLDELSLQLGTMAMSEASSFLSALWYDYEGLGGSYGDVIAIDWDRAFVNAPIFLM